MILYKKFNFVMNGDLFTGEAFVGTRVEETNTQRGVLTETMTELGEIVEILKNGEEVIDYGADVYERIEMELAGI